MARQVLQPWADAYQPWADAYETWRSGASDLLAKTGARARRDNHGCNCAKCGGSHCESDRCACRCCVNDSDLVLETRVGERRIISLVIENHWRRERPIELELSSWTSTLQGAVVSSTLLTVPKFILAPCSDAQVTIAVEVADPQQASDPQPVSDPLAGNLPTDVIRKLPDVSQCAVSYADLRVKGCDLRSIRLAVAVLPRDCDAYKVDCACGCC
jgi:hypothetical protein